MSAEQIYEEIHNITSAMEEEINHELPVTGEMIALLTILSLFTVVGSVGNGLVLFVFSRVREKTTAQLFILALALIDLFTCMVIIPFTMFVEYTRYDIKYDFLCKLYQFLITSKVPLSAFIMVAIAFDRYFCICHPLRKIITPWRTKVIIVCLTLFASMLGVMTSLAYGVYQVFNPMDPKHLPDMKNVTEELQTYSTTREMKDWTLVSEDPSTKSDVTLTVELRLRDWILRHSNLTALYMRENFRELVYIGVCAPNEILLGWGFVSVYQKCYSALFVVCLVIVGVLYGMIYRFIGLRRSKKLQQRLVLCAYVNGENGCGEAGTRTTLLNGNGHDDDKYGCNGQGLGAGGVYIGGCTTTSLPFNKNPTPGTPSGCFNGPTVKSGKGEQQDRTDDNSHAGGSDDKGKKNKDTNENGLKQSLVDRPDELNLVSSNSFSGGETLELQPLRKSLSDKISTTVPSPDDRRPKSLTDDASGNVHVEGRLVGGVISRGVHKGSYSPRTGLNGRETDGRKYGRKRRRDSEPLPKGAYEVSFLDNLTAGTRGPYLETSIEEDFPSFSEKGVQPPQVVMFECPSPSSDHDPPSSGDSMNQSAMGCFQPCTGDRGAATSEHNAAVRVQNWSSVGDPDLSVFTSHGIVVTSPSWNDLLCGASMEGSRPERPASFGNCQEFTEEDDPSSPLLQCQMRTVPVCNETRVAPKQTPDFDLPFKKVSNSESANAAEARLAAKATHEHEEANMPLFNTDSGYNHGGHIAKEDPSTNSKLHSNDFEKDKATCTDLGPVSDNDSVFLPSKDEDNNSQQLNNKGPQPAQQQQQSFLTAYVRNLTPRISSSSSVLSCSRYSVSEGSRRSTMEGTSRRPTMDAASRRLTVETYIDRRSTMESRRSTMESGARRPANIRKKRWQHFRSKNASIKGNHNRGHGGSAGGPRRSILPYDADRLREENRAANARTALMLFTVTVVFVVAFLPAWLMAHRLVPTQLMVFYLYFTYNVANPFIYAFMNVIFKDHLRKIFGCKRRT
nr:hypothetical protein BaRGS_021483 [Batillaria attramentaria]